MTGDLRQNSQAPRRILLLLITLTLIRGLIYAAVTIPWWAGHDEEFHFAHVRMLIDQRLANDLSQDPSWPREMVATFAAFPVGRWSRWPERQINSAEVPDRYVNFVRPSLSYYPYIWLGLFLTRQDLLFQLLAMRLVSVSITCGTIVFAFLSARQIFADSPMMQVLVPWLVLFNPAYMVMASTVSDGNLAILLSTIVFYLLVGVTKGNASRRLPLAFGLTILAIGTSIGYAALREQTDQSVRSTDSLAKVAQAPVLAGIPEIITSSERFRKRFIILFSVLLLLVLIGGTVAAFHYYIMDLDIFWAKVARRFDTLFL